MIRRLELIAEAAIGLALPTAVFWWHYPAAAVAALVGGW